MTQMLELADKKFKAITITMLKGVREYNTFIVILTINEKIENHIREPRTVKKKNQIKIPELKKKIPELENSWKIFKNTRLAKQQNGNGKGKVSVKFR